MDERRLRDLESKRDGEGLTAEEADELGRLMAERDGRPYSSAKDRPDPDTIGQDHPEKPGSEDEMREVRQHPDVRSSPDE